VIAINTIVLDAACSQLSGTATVVPGGGVFVPRWCFVVIFGDAGQPIPKTHGSLCQREKEYAMKKRTQATSNGRKNQTDLRLKSQEEQNTKTNGVKSEWRKIP